MENLYSDFISDISFVLKSRFALFTINQNRGTEYNYVK